MILIILLNIFVVTCSFFAGYKKYRPLLGLGFYVLTLMFGVRYGYGNDYFNYYEVFINSQFSSPSSVDTDIGWYILCRLLGPIGYPGFIFLLTIFTQYLVYRFIKQNVSPEWYWFAVLIYLFQPNFMLLGCSMMRQFLVMVILLNVLDIIVERKIFIAIIIVLLAATIHKIALLFIPFIFLDYLKRCFKNIWFYVIVFFILCIVWKYSESIAIQLATTMLDSNTDFTSYLYSIDEGQIGMREILLMLYFTFLMIRNYDKLSAINQLASILTLISVFVLPFTTMVIMLRRVMYIFMLYQISSFPAVVDKERNVIYRYMFVACFILFTFIDFIRFFYSETYGTSYIEFKTIFQSPDWK